MVTTLLDYCAIISASAIAYCSKIFRKKACKVGGKFDYWMEKILFHRIIVFRISNTIRHFISYVKSLNSNESTTQLIDNSCSARREE